jgi:membrane protein DedA with SNARE-associated domain
VAPLLPYLALVALLVLGGVVSPVPEEALLAAAGFAVAHGDLALAPALGAGIVGVVLGDLAIFATGAAVGRGVRASGLIRPSASMRGRAERALGRFGALAIVAARLVPGLRGAVFFVAGSARMGIRRVVLLDLAAAAVQVPVVTALGMLAERA